MRTAVTFAGLLSILVVSASPSKAEESSQVLNELSQEYATCWAYYALIKMCLSPEKDAELIVKYDSVSQQVGYFAFELAKNAGLSQEGASARLKLALKQMQESTGSDCRNISVALERHGPTCKSVLEDPTAAVQRARERAGVP